MNYFNLVEHSIKKIWCLGQKESGNSSPKIKLKEEIEKKSIEIMDSHLNYVYIEIYIEDFTQLWQHKKKNVKINNKNNTKMSIKRDNIVYFSVTSGNCIE